MSLNPSVTIIGCTGGTGLAVLRFCLRGNLPTTVLVRDPSKLTALLDLPSLPSTLNVITGSIRDDKAARSSLLTPQGTVSDIIISSLGMTPPSLGKILSGNTFTGADRKICEEGTGLIVDALRGLKQDGKKTATGKDALLVTLSTTGISKVDRDIPLYMVPFYAMLDIPHDDKANMEAVLQAIPEDGQEWVIMRPSFLGGTGKEPLPHHGQQQREVHVGIGRAGMREKKAIGGFIKRLDVGQWIFEEVIMKLDQARIAYNRAAVSLTN